MVDRSDDLALFGLEPHGGGRWTFELERRLSRLDGRLYGGTAMAVAIVLGEVESDRPALWSTVQFISSATAVGDTIECQVEVLAAGRRTCQVRVRAFDQGTEVFCALGATGHDRPDKLSGTFETMPLVLGPDESPPHRFPGIGRMIPPELLDEMRSVERLQEIRAAIPTPGYESPPGELLFWTRVTAHPAASPATLGYCADLVPMSVAAAAGRAGGGTSIDNTLRFGRVSGDDAWVLAQLDPHLASSGYGHGTVHLWSVDGRLLATGSQTAALLLFD